MDTTGERQDLMKQHLAETLTDRNLDPYITVEDLGLLEGGDRYRTRLSFYAADRVAISGPSREDGFTSGGTMSTLMAVENVDTDVEEGEEHHKERVREGKKTFENRLEGMIFGTN